MDKKLKKKLIKAQAKRHHLVTLMAETHQEETARAAEQEAERLAEHAAAAASAPDEPVWSARMQEIRNKNTARKRMAQERWNRFAGTSGSGGRGR